MFQSFFRERSEHLELANGWNISSVLLFLPRTLKIQHIERVSGFENTKKRGPGYCSIDQLVFNFLGFQKSFHYFVVSRFQAWNELVVFLLIATVMLLISCPTASGWIFSFVFVAVSRYIHRALKWQAEALIYLMWGNEFLDLLFSAIVCLVFGFVIICFNVD